MRRFILLLSVLLIAFLVYLSILSAFYGSAKATVFFNSKGMAAFWLVLLIIPVISFFVFSSLRHRLGPLLIHLACIFILAGSLWGSQTGHELRSRYLDESRFYEGYLVLHEGFSDARLLTKDKNAVVGELPFHLVLENFSILYHPTTNMGSAQPKQFRSRVIFVSDEGKELAREEISVNHPAVYGGYHFYQSAYGRDHHGTYTVLHVRAFSGLYAVYAGYALLCIGLVWSLWVKTLLPVIWSYKPGDYGY